MGAARCRCLGPGCWFGMAPLAPRGPAAVRILDRRQSERARSSLRFFSEYFRSDRTCFVFGASRFTARAGSRCFGGFGSAIVSVIRFRRQSLSLTADALSSTASGERGSAHEARPRFDRRESGHRHYRHRRRKGSCTTVGLQHQRHHAASRSSSQGRRA